MATISAASRPVLPLNTATDVTYFATSSLTTRQAGWGPAAADVYMRLEAYRLISPTRPSSIFLPEGRARHVHRYNAPRKIIYDMPLHTSGAFHYKMRQLIRP